MYDGRIKEAADDEDNYQVNQAKIAIAKGGIVGMGPGNSEHEIFFRIPIQILFMPSLLKSMD